MARIDLTSDKMQHLAQVITVSGNMAGIFLDAQERNQRGELQELMFKLDLQDKEQGRKDQERARSDRQNEILYHRQRDAVADERVREQMDYQREQDLKGERRTRQQDELERRRYGRQRASELRNGRFNRSSQTLEILNGLAGVGTEAVGVQEGKFKGLFVNPAMNMWHNDRMSNIFPDQDPTTVATALASAFQQGPVKDASQLIDRSGLTVGPKQRAALETILRVQAMVPGNALADTYQQEQQLKGRVMQAGMAFAEEFGPEFSMATGDTQTGDGGSTGQPILNSGQSSSTEDKPVELFGGKLPESVESGLRKVPVAFGALRGLEGMQRQAMEEGKGVLEDLNTLGGAGRWLVDPFKEGSLPDRGGDILEMMAGTQPIPEGHWMGKLFFGKR